MTFKFRVADTEGYLTAGEFPDGNRRARSS